MLHQKRTPALSLTFLLVLATSLAMPFPSNREHDMNKFNSLEHDQAFHEQEYQPKHRFAPNPSKNRAHHHINAPVIEGSRQMQRHRRNGPTTITATGGLHNDANMQGLNNDAVYWGRDCSRENMTAFVGQNGQFMCEMWIPVGSVISWHKGNILKQFYNHSAQRARTSNNVVQPHMGINMFHIMSIYYVDCVTQEDQAEYELKIETPEGHIAKRTFHLNVEDQNNIGMCCDVWCEGARITEFAKTIAGREGDRLVLPCKPDGPWVNTEWKKSDGELLTQLPAFGYTISYGGDLIIQNLKSEDNGKFVCDIEDYYGQVITHSTHVEVHI